MGLLHEALPASTLVVAIDRQGEQPGLAELERGRMAVERLSLPVLRPGLEDLQRLVLQHLDGADPVFAIEATGGTASADVVDPVVAHPLPGCRVGP